MGLYKHLRKLWAKPSPEREKPASWAARCYPPEVRDIAARVMTRLVDMFSVDPNHFSPTSTFYEDIGLISLDDVELIMEVEEEFGISISEEDAGKMRTLGELIDCVQKLLPQQPVKGD